MERSSKEHQGNIREVIHLAWPIVISMLSYTAMGVTDTLFVGWIGKAEIGAVGLATMAFFLVNSFFLGALTGVKIVSAQATGASDARRAEQSTWQGMIVAVPFGLVVIALAGLHEIIFSAMGGTEAVCTLAGEYFVARVFSAPIWYITMAICNGMQGTGDTRTPMRINLVANGLNIALDPMFIFGFGPIPAMGVTGAGIATVLACAGGMVMSLVIHSRQHGLWPRFEREVMKRMLSLGLPTGVRFFLEVGGWVFFTSILSRMGENELAANQIAISIIKVSFLPGYAISDAACILAGNYFGAGNFHGVRKSFQASMKVAIAVMAFFGLLFWILPELFLRCFQDDPAVIEIGCELLLVAAVFQIFDAIAMVATGTLNGVGDTRYTMYISVLAAWLVLVPLAYFFGVTLGWGALGAWLGITGQVVALSIVLTWRFYTNGWRKACEPCLA
ncbi:MAG: MATE family efflux transporter [Planctomycetota bacterium]